MRKFGAGLLALSIKIALKILSILAKVFKTVKVGKVGMAAASMASYAFMFTWQFAVMIMVMLFVHESGHIWAMKRCGIKTKGIYFIPFVGGAAVADSEFPSRKAEVFIAIMGPIWGFALSAVVGLIYLLTNDPLYAAVASWMAMVNLFNLLPINPLDGGRIMKSIAFSIHSRSGLVFLAIGLVAAGFIAVYVKLILFVVLLVVGVLELVTEYKRREELPSLKPLGIFTSTAIYCAVVGVLWGFMASMNHIPGAAEAMKVIAE